MSANPVLIEYAFMFDPADTFAHLFQFEQSLAKAFETMGLEAHIVKGIDGQCGRRVLLLKPKEEMDTPKDNGGVTDTKTEDLD